MVVRHTEQGIGLVFTNSVPEFNQQPGRIIGERRAVEPTREPARLRRAAGS
jgi:hypothetical protein